MGRSKNKRSTRTVSTNHRLRSASNASSYSPSQVPYGGYRYLGGLLSPSTKPQPYSRRRTPVRDLPYATPSQPASRSNPGRIRVYQPLPAGIRTQKPTKAAGPDKAPEDSQTMVCVSRSERREVLHALRKTGKAGQKRPVYNWKSEIHCKKRR